MLQDSLPQFKPHSELFLVFVLFPSTTFEVFVLFSNIPLYQTAADISGGSGCSMTHVKRFNIIVFTKFVFFLISLYREVGGGLWL